MPFDVYSQAGADAKFLTEVDGGDPDAAPLPVTLRRGTSAEWADANPILAAGEPAVVLDSGQPAELVLGDGVTAMADLRAAVWGDDARLALAGTATQPGDLGTAAAADASDFATAAQGVHEARKFEIRRAKGGVIGTAGKGVVAWRADHLIDQHLSTTWPILRDRGMPCGLGVVTKAIPPSTLNTEPTTTTWDQLRTMHWEGCEIWSHSATHKEPAPLGTGGGLSLADEITGSRTELESQNLRVMGWQSPGVNPGPILTPGYSNNFDTMDKFTTEAGQLYLANYGLIEMGGNPANAGAVRYLPTQGTYAYAHSVTVESSTLANCQKYVDLAATLGVGVELMFHPKYVGMAGQMTVADFTALADYVKQKWDDGSIEVLTPSGLAFADPGTSRRANLITNGDFEGLTLSGDNIGPWVLTTATGVTVGTDGGHSGSNYVRLGATSTGLLRQSNTYVRQLGVQGASFIVDAWVRAPLSDGTVRIDIVDNSGNTPAFSTFKTFALTGGATWQKVRVPFCIPKTCTNLMVRIRRWTGDAVDVDDVTVRAI